MAIAIPLSGLLQHKMGCEYLSGLRFLKDHRQMWLAHALERIPFSMAALPAWNNAPAYLARGEPPLKCGAGTESPRRKKTIKLEAENA